MPRPADPLSLIYSPSKSFPYANWGQDLRTYQYFRVFGYSHYKSRAQIFDDSLVEDEGIVTEAKKIIEDKWKAALPPTSENKDHISKLGKNQVKRVRRGDHVSFQSACLAIVALELAIAKSQNPIDIYAGEHPISICPTLFAVDHYDQTFYEAHIARDPTTFAELIKATGQIRRSRQAAKNIFEEMAEPRLVTEQLSGRFLDFWKGKDAAKLASYALCVPRNGRAYWGKSEQEIEVFPQG